MNRGATKQNDNKVTTIAYYCEKYLSVVTKISDALEYDCKISSCRHDSRQSR